MTAIGRQRSILYRAEIGSTGWGKPTLARRAFNAANAPNRTSARGPIFASPILISQSAIFEMIANSLFGRETPLMLSYRNVLCAFGVICSAHRRDQEPLGALASPPMNQDVGLRRLRTFADRTSRSSKRTDFEQASTD